MGCMVGLQVWESDPEGMGNECDWGTLYKTPK